MTNYTRIARQTIWVYVLIYLALPVSFFIRAVYARQLTVVDYGLFFGLFAFFGFFSYIRDWGLSGGLTYFGNKFLVRHDYAKVKLLFLINQGFQLAASLVFAILFFVFQDFITGTVYRGEGHIVFLFRFFILYWVLETVYVTNTTLFSIFEEQYIPKLLDVFNRIIILVLSLAGFRLLEHYQVPVIAYLASMVFLVVASSSILYTLHKKVFQSRVVREARVVREFFAFSFLSILGSVSSLIFAQTDTFIVQLMLGAGQVGYYVSGLAAAEVLLTLVVPLTLITAPLFAKLWHRESVEELSRLVSFIFNNLIILALPFSLFFFLYARKIVYVIFGPSYYPAIPLLQLWSFIVVVKMYNFFLFQVMVAMGKPGKSSRITFFSGVLNIALDIVLIALFGTIGAVIATGIAFIVMNIFFSREIRKGVRISYQYPEIIKTFIAGIPFALAVILLKDVVMVIDVGRTNYNYFLNGLLIFAIAFACYCLSLLALRVVSREKISYIKAVVFPRMKR